MTISPSPFTIVDVSELSRIDEPFVDIPSVSGRPVIWKRHSGLPASFIERAVTRPRLSRYRAAWNAVADARAANIIVSHLPRMSAAVGQLSAHRRVRVPHLAFSFNFTDLPGAAGRVRFGRQLRDVDQFCTFTRFEAELYAEAFGLPPTRFRPVTWTQAVPEVAPVDRATLPEGVFVVAIGGEGRDFEMLLAAARAHPATSFVVIARPTAALIALPPNVIVRYNLPPAVCWGIAIHAAALLVPLRSSDTCCGHITLVSGRLLGLPIVTTSSRGTDDYTLGFGGTRLVAPGDKEGWIEAVREIIDRPADTRDLASADAVSAVNLYDRRHWATYVEDFAARHA